MEMAEQANHLINAWWQLQALTGVAGAVSDLIGVPEFSI